MKRILALAVAFAGCNGPAGGGGGSGALAGTWELAGASGTSQGTLTLSSTRVTVILGGDAFDLSLDGTPTLSWSDHSQATSIAVTHGGGAINGGALPFTLGGDWSFSANGRSCSATVQAASIIGSCSGAGGNPIVDLNRHATATRTQQLSSIFGDLGGVWTISDEYNNSCTITLSGSTLTGDCGGTNSGTRPGVTVMFGDGVVSGTTASGAEFSARRI